MKASTLTSEGQAVQRERFDAVRGHIDYSKRVLRIGSDDPRDLEPFAELLGGGV